MENKETTALKGEYLHGKEVAIPERGKFFHEAESPIEAPRPDPTLYYSAQTRGFYHSQIHGEAIPPDAVEIAEARHRELMEAQGNGHVINHDALDANGHPTAEPFKLTPAQMAASLRVTRNRLLTQTDGLVARHRDEVELGLGLSAVMTLTPEQFAELQRWRQALREAPKQADFPDAGLPAKPEWLELKA